MKFGLTFDNCLNHRSALICKSFFLTRPLIRKIPCLLVLQVVPLSDRPAIALVIPLSRAPNKLSQRFLEIFQKPLWLLPPFHGLKLFLTCKGPYFCIFDDQRGKCELHFRCCCPLFTFCPPFRVVDQVLS